MRTGVGVRGSEAWGEPFIEKSTRRPLHAVSSQVATFVFNFVLWTVVAMALYFGQANQIEANCDVPFAFAINLFQGILWLLLLLWAAFVLWGVNDAYLLKYEFMYLLGLGLPLFIVWAISSQLG